MPTKEKVASREKTRLVKNGLYIVLDKRGSRNRNRETSHFKMAELGNSKLKNRLQKTPICELTSPKIRFIAMQHT